jgi:hypothetical protein
MKKITIISWVVSLLMLALLASCADDSPVSSLEEEYHYSSSSSCTSIIDCADAGSRPPGYSSSSKKYSSSSYVSESEKCCLGTSSKSDSYCCSYYGYQCSYTSNETEEEKEMVLTLTYYKQNKTIGEDRDPEISFTVYTINSDGDTLQSLKTDQLTDWDNVTEWDVRIEASPLTIAAGVATIYVCPIIIDDDGILGNQNLSSKYCYGSGNIGTLKNGDVVEQSDSENTKASLEWEWYLY